MKFSIARLLAATSCFAISLTCFYEAAWLDALAYQTMRGPVRISFFAIGLNWFGMSLILGAIAMIPFGRRGLALGTIGAFLLIPLVLLILLYPRQ